MLGQFLEVALVCADPGSAWQHLQSLGFEPASTGDIFTHAYGVVACGGVAIGLHAQGDDALSVVFVRPEVAALHRELTARGIDIEAARLGSDVFNELTLREPGGVALRVIEARSFSPPPRLPARTATGRFIALSLPCADLAAAREFWHGLGYATADNHLALERFSIESTPLACHSRRAMRQPTMLFEDAAVDGDAFAAMDLPIGFLSDRM